MLEVEKLTDAELRAELAARGENVGPVVGTTRLLYEKKLKKLIIAGKKTVLPIVKKPKSLNKSITKPSKPPKTPERSRRSMISTMDTTQNSTFNRSETENSTDSDEDEEILSPKPKSRQTSFSRRPVSSTPTKQFPVAKNLSSSFQKPSRISSVHVPNLITDFTPKFSFSNRTGEYSGKEEDYEGVESSRIISEPSRNSGIVKSAWNKVLGSPKNSSEISWRTRKNHLKIQESQIFNDAVWVALYAILIVFGVLLAAFFVTSEKSTIPGSLSILKTILKDSISFLYNYAIVPVVSIGSLILLATGIYFGIRKYREAKEAEEVELYELIDKITELVEESAAEGDPYVSQPHVRDLLFPPSKRRPTELARWEKAVQFIDSHESRISTDVTILASGNECAVWKWIGHQKRRF